MRLAAVLPLCLGTVQTAHAALPDEFAVYADDIAAPGEVSLELHFNTTPDGIKTPSYPGEIVAHNGWRLTPELSYGINRDWEIGLYVPTVWANGVYYAPGARAKLKWMPIKAAENAGNYFFGMNLEASSINRKFESARSLELKLIGGMRRAGWELAANPSLVWAVDSFQQSPNGLLSLRASRSVSDMWAAGAEYYSSVGRASSTLPFSQQSNILFAVVDYGGEPLKTNFGIGRGMTNASDKWTVKTVIEVPL